MDWTDILSVLLALVEFWIGFNILFGRNRSLVLSLCGVVMVGFTGFTLYLALANPISDCGCFGDAVVLSNWETFWKNVVLLVCYFVLLLLRKHYKRLFTNRLNLFSYSLYGYLCIGLCLWLCWVGFNRIPVLDFRPFKSGINIAEAMGIASSTGFEEVEYRFIYEKGGERKEFTLENLPSEDEGWIPVDRIEVSVANGAADLHSGIYGGAVYNPAMVLSKMLSQIVGEDGHINIPGFYDDVRELTADERKALNRVPFCSRKYKAGIGVGATYGEEGYTTLERVGVRPTFEINGMWSGYIGEGRKTIIPAVASAKITMRLVPYQTPDKITKLFKEHFKSLAPKGVKVDIRPMHGGVP